MVNETDVVEETEVKKPSKADKLEAKAARLRAAEEARAARADDADDAARAEPESRRRRWLTAGLASLAVLLSVGLVLALVTLRHRDDRLNRLSDRAAARDSALVAAQKYAVDFGSYDYRHLQRDFALVSSHLTPEFAKKYATISARLKDVIVQYKGTSTAAVQGAAVASVSGTRATVLVFLDQTVTSAQATAPRVDRNRLQMSLVRHTDGRWLIADLALK